MVLGERIRAARKRRGLSQGGLAEMLGVPQSCLSNWETDAHQPRRERLADLARIFGWDSVDWELGGQRHDDVLGGGFVYVSEYVLKADNDGNVRPHFPKSAKKWPFRRDYFEASIGVDVSRCGIETVRGDSMEPTLKSGDKIVVNFTHNNPARPGIYVIAQGGLTVVLRVDPIPGTKPLRLRLIAENNKHGVYEVKADDIELVGSVGLKLSTI